MAQLDPNEVSSLLDSLPAVFQEDRSGGVPNFLGRFLLGFEDVLLGRDATLPSEKQGIEQQIASVERYFEPGFEVIEQAERQLPLEQSAPHEFLRWLAGWVALTLRDDLSKDPVTREKLQRQFISKAAHLYRRRGTKSGILDFLSIFTEVGTPYIEELADAFQIGVHSQIGVDTRLDGGPAFFFVVHIKLLPTSDPTLFNAEIKAKKATARAIIDLQKPAHTNYDLVFDGVPRMQIGVSSQIGVDTLILDAELTFDSED